MSAIATHVTPAMRRQTRALHIDLPMVWIFSALLMTGLVMVASSSIVIADRELESPFYYLVRQCAYAGLGVMGLLLMLACPLRFWVHSGYVLLAFALLLLAAVLIPGLGHSVNGSVRWLRFGPLSLQASEPARLLLIMYLAGYMVRHPDSIRENFKGFMKPMVFMLLAAALLLLEPDFGAATVLLGTALGMLFLGGVRLRHFLFLFVIVGGAFAALALTSPYRLQRLTGFLDPWADAYASGYQLTQSLIAIGRGEWFGVGLGASVQKLYYLPEAHTDFVFAVLAEEFGLAGVVVVIALYMALLWRAFSIAQSAMHAEAFFGAWLARGIGIWFGLQAFINIGVNMGVLPTKGLTLPLISSGGSSLLVSCAAVGLLLRVAHEARPKRAPLPPRLRRRARRAA
ncbi:MAG: putative lipid II flippase FtsW [Gammaproteobacteria bacterium]|nr:putative lipid II flippase FtsW [Gammaproteobacteria bacterium]